MAAAAASRAHAAALLRGLRRLGTSTAEAERERGARWELSVAREYYDYRKSIYGDVTHRALLVDAVGTLVVPAQPTAQVYKSIGEKYGVKYTEDEILMRYRWAYEQPWGRSRLRSAEGDNHVTQDREKTGDKIEPGNDQAFVRSLLLALRSGVEVDMKNLLWRLHPYRDDQRLASSIKLGLIQMLQTLLNLIEEAIGGTSISIPIHGSGETNIGRDAMLYPGEAAMRSRTG